MVNSHITVKELVPIVIIYLLILYAVFPIEKCAIIFKLHSYSSNQKCARFKSDESRCRYNYPSRLALATIIRKWLLLSELSLFAVAVKVPRC